MRPNNHVIKRQGCPKCANLIKGEWRRSNTEEFVEKSNVIHKNKYNYSLVEYKNNYSKVTIICPEHR